MVCFGQRRETYCRPRRRQGHSAFNLDPPIGHIIHTVGPIGEGGAYGEPEILASCYRRSLQLADDLNATSIAFPAIATGVYGYPSDQAAHIAVTTLSQTLTRVATIRLVAFDQQTYDLLAAELSK